MSVSALHPYQLKLLPPQVDINNSRFSDLLLKARTELAELKGYTFSMPNPMLLLSPAIIKESIASSNIENINTTVVEVLQNQLFPETDRRDPDKEVLRYRDAVLWGFDRLKKLPVSTRLILGAQKILIPSSRGEYRKQQNQIKNMATGEVQYTPPAAPEISRLIGNWEEYVNKIDDKVDPLIKSAVAHYQFEAIHPFDDGNGRTGRILIVLQLVAAGILHLPILYISGYINKNRSKYYQLLREVTFKQNWDEFLFYMLNGFYEQAKETKEIFFKIMQLFGEFKEQVKTKHKKIYSADLIEQLFSYPIITPVKMASLLGTHYTTASRHLMTLAKSGMLKEQRYGKYHFFINSKLIQVLNK